MTSAILILRSRVSHRDII